MAAPSWFWPLSGMTARGNSLVPFGSGMAVPDWTTPIVWPFNGTAFSPSIILSTGTPGLWSAAPATSGGLWAVAVTGTLWEVPPVGAPTAHPLTAGEIYVGCAVAGGNPYVVNSFGAVRNAVNALVGTFGGSGAVGLAASGSTLFAPLPALSGIGTMAAPGGVTGLIALPAAMATPTCLAAASGRPLLVGGYMAATPLSGATAAALNPADPTRMLAVGAGRAILWTNARGFMSDTWMQGQVLGGTATLGGVVWTPNGVQALATSVSSGALQVFNYSAGVLSLAQTLAVSGAVSIAMGDSANALVVQSGVAHVALASASLGVWASGVAFNVTGATAAVAYAPGSVAVTYSGGLALTQLASAGVWTAPTYVPLGFSPTLLAADTFGQTYAAASGFMAVVSGGVVVGSGVLPAGLPTGLVVQQGRVCVAMPSVSAIQVMGLTGPGTWTAMGSAALALGASVGLGLSQTTLFAMGSGSTVTLGFSGTPYALTPVLAGAVGQWGGASWTTTVMGPSYTPSAVGFDASGNAWVATTQNDLWSITSGGVLLGTSIVPQQSGQAQSVPLGSSALLAASGQMWVATSIAGMLVEAA
jgi:hypothetical protein